MEEKRGLQRFSLEIPATIRVVTSGREKEILNLLTRNICSGGALFHTTEPLPEGVRVKIDLVLPLDKLKKLRDEYKQAHIKVTGRVLRSESDCIAVCFDQDYQIAGLAKLP